MREARHWSQSLEQTPIMLQFFVSASITWLESAIHGSFLSQSQDFQRELHFSFSFFFILLCLTLPLPGHYGRMLLKLAQVNSQACSTCVTPLWPCSSKITTNSILDTSPLHPIVPNRSSSSWGLNSSPKLTLSFQVP